MDKQATSKKSWRFWAIFLSMCLVSFASALDATIVVTALPTAIDSIGGADVYVWMVNSFVLAATVIQPFVGQVSNVFGRRSPMLVSVALFILGSGLAGGASNAAMFIAGRTVQGLGSGGLFVLVDLITCDLVPMRERGQYLGVMLGTAALGTTLGPLIGGAFAESDWRWTFYINLPIAGVAFCALVFLLKLSRQRNASWPSALARVDWIGNAIFMPSMVAILLGLIFGGAEFAWGSYHVVVPLVLGFFGCIVFGVYEVSPWCKEPSVPSRLFTNRTSAVGFAISFISAMLLEWTFYFLPIYFQGVKTTSPLVSGVNVLPLSVCFIPFAGVAGGIMTKTGLYRPIHFWGFSLVAIGFGLFVLLDQSSSRAAWACFQIIVAAGIGPLMTCILPSIQASLPESDAATSTATYSFVRSFGFVWGVTIPSIILNSRFEHRAGDITDPQARQQLTGGTAYTFATRDYLLSLDSTTRQQVIEIFTDGLRADWYAALAFSLLGFLLVLASKHVPLREELVNDFGLDEGQTAASQVEDKATVSQEAIPKECPGSNV